ncbi:MAP7 domain-containing protein 3 isoform X2 [Microcaecilia unicolor]|uniref:MAP7 domain-containing protein 3 isoform X2 n=1 Tax=Microcaecilia unicolor TaxID=1415580 RepID=A0A6P7YRW3_9AMPH|nr:MAP7 domain-containing protein 3 isoform X2 [Microcaecilia unicolor]
MAESGVSLKGLREQMVAAAQAIADERRNQSGNSPILVQSPAIIKTSTKPVIDGSTLKTDERQRLARSRREELEKHNAAKESQILEREKKAKLQYEKQMEERQRKLDEQKQKEELRRAAVEEKRKQKVEEEKERYEAALRRTLERSQRLEQRQKRWSWGGAPTSEPDNKTTSKRSSSITNLKQTDMVLNKHLSSSSAILPNSSDKSIKQRSASLNRLSNKVPVHSQQLLSKMAHVEQKGGSNQKRSSSLSRLTNKPQSAPQLEKAKNEEKSARRSQTNPLDSNIISRLLAPTQASLARSKSAAALSSDGKDPPESHLCPRSASATFISSPVHTPKGPMRSRSIDRQKATSAASISSTEASSQESAQKSEMEKRMVSHAGKRPPSPSSISSRRRSPSPANMRKCPPSPSTIKQNQKYRPPSPSLLKQRPPSPTSALKSAPIQRSSLISAATSVTKKKSETESKPKNKCEETAEHVPGSQTSEKEVGAVSAKTKEGTTTAEEAAKILAEKRRIAREQREREKEERIQRQEEERIRKEEMVEKEAKERAQREEEEHKLEEKRKHIKEEEQKKAEEERVLRELEEQERLAELQQQKEEAEAKAQEEAERQRQEREKIMQQNMQERLQRKKRIEEIMKRTRKTDHNDAKSEERSDQGTEDSEEGPLILYQTDQLDKINNDGLSQEIIMSSESGSKIALGLCLLEDSLLDTEKVQAHDIFMNGDEQSIDQKNNNKEPLDTSQEMETSSPSEEISIQNSGPLEVNTDSLTVELVQNLNGKSNTWTFEQIIDLGVHSKSSKLTSEGLTAENNNQNLIDAAKIPSSPILAFEEVEAVNSLTKPIEASSEM